MSVILPSGRGGVDQRHNAGLVFILIHYSDTPYSVPTTHRNTNPASVPLQYRPRLHSYSRQCESCQSSPQYRPRLTIQVNSSAIQTSSSFLFPTIQVNSPAWAWQRCPETPRTASQPRTGIPSPQACPCNRQLVLILIHDNAGQLSRFSVPPQYRPRFYSYSR